MRMISAIRHRGPDGFGMYRDDRAGLVHARLAIVDLIGGTQPLTNTAAAAATAEDHTADENNCQTHA
jgi:asparagine synthetase B (glutamine-hydrolysing)